MGKTNIEWADATWNPIRARHRGTGKVGHYCEMVSPGCAHCYASTMQKRFGMPAYPGEGKRVALPLAGDSVAVNDEIEVFLDENVLLQPLGWKKPRRVFVCSMTDLFGEWVPDAWLDRCFVEMALSPQHTFQVLTKRAERMRDYIAGMGIHLRKFGEIKTWPPSNVWLGVSVENQQTADERIPLLLQTPATVRFVSAEPLLDVVDFGSVGLQRWDVLRGWKPAHEGYPEGANTSRLDWIIIGGESGPNARPCNIECIRSIVEQCRAEGVACFVKQLGSNAYDGNAMSRVYGADRKYDTTNPTEKEECARVLGTMFQAAALHLRDSKGGNPSEWPYELVVRQYPEVNS